MRPDDDRVWLDALAGRAPEGIGGATAREAEHLRAGILARAIEEADPVPAIDPRREEDLLDRARREGVLPLRAKGGRAWWTGWAGRTLLAAAATLAAVLVGIVMRSGPAPEAVRGGSSATVRLHAPDPRALQRQIVDELRAAGVEATPYERLGLYGIDADLPTPVPLGVRKVLERHRIPVPADDALTIEIGADP